MSSEEQVLSHDSPPFKIRQFVSTIRGQDFSRCWPFSQRILERCLLLGMKVELPPLESSSNGYIYGSCNNSTEISFSNHSRRAESIGLSNGTHKRVDTKESAELARRRLAEPEKLVLCGDAVNLEKTNAFYNSQSCLLFSQSSEDSAPVKPSTESFWDDNAICLSTGDTSISGSQMLMQGKAESPYHTGVNFTGKPDALHAARDDMAVFEEPICSLFQVAKEEGFIAHTKPSIDEPHITCTLLPGQGKLGEIPPSACHGKGPDYNGSPEAVCKPVLQLTEFESNGFIPKTDKSKHAVDPGHSDASTQVCPVCLKFSSGSNTALNAHIDHCLVPDETGARPSKKRFKIRKLRSMVDIYATAPVRTLEDLEMSSQTWSLHKI